MIYMSGNLQRYKVKTIYIKIPEMVYERLLKYKLVYSLDEIIVNHLIDILDEREAKRNERIKDDLEDLDNEDIPELKGMTKK